jgi:RNA polymerase subunit RPABC4/transcription elongation factor Spt4/very-short-patch-repair endonuclease
MSPGSFLYHEGAKWVSYRFLSTPGGLRERTSERYLCRSCGAIVETDRDTCPYCKSELSPEKREILRLLEFTNVAARKSSRITVNEEERIKVFQNIWSSFYIPEGQARRVRRASLALSEDGELPLTYLPSAELHYINQGVYRKPGQEGGFLIDLETGRFLKEKEVQEAARPERYDFYVKVVRNALSIRPNGIVNTGNLEELYSFAYALKRGIEATFQLEETELGLEVLGQDEHLHLLYIEESEGGLGVLRRLVEEPALLADVARKALEVLHFDGEEDTKPECERACYECLLSYGNHKKAPYLNRHKARKVLEELAKASGFFVFNPNAEDEEERFRELLERCQSGLERRFLEFLRANRLPLPDAAQRRISEASTIADFFYKPNIAVYIDGPVHQKEQQRKIDEHQRRKLMERGYRVVVFGEDTDAWLEIFRARLADALTNAQYV